MSDSKIDPYLNDIWSIFFHDPFDSDWNFGSYIKLTDIANIHDFWNFLANMNHNITMGMFFLTREHIFPCWDDPENINGGCLSIKVLKNILPEYLEEVMILILGESMIKKEYRVGEDWNVVNGISTSPKKSFCIVKIWLRTNKFTDKKFFNIPEGFYGDVIYRSNNENMTLDKNQSVA